MLESVLVTISGTPHAEAAARLAVGLARRHRARLTLLPVVGVEAWKRGLPALMSTAHAARLLDARPWDVLRERAERVAAHLREECAREGIALDVLAPTRDMEEGVAGVAAAHDLVVVALQALVDEGVVDGAAAWIEAVLEPGRPAVLAAGRVRAVRRVLALRDGSAESDRAWRAFTEMDPWPDAAVELATLDDAERDAASAAWAAPDRLTVTLVDELSDRDVFERQRRTGAEAVVIGGPGRRRASRRRFETLLAEADGPVFATG